MKKRTYQENKELLAAEALKSLKMYNGFLLGSMVTSVACLAGYGAFVLYNAKKAHDSTTSSELDDFLNKLNEEQAHGNHPDQISQVYQEAYGTEK